jgi:hypothetical protein
MALFYLIKLHASKECFLIKIPRLNNYVLSKSLFEREI